MRKYTISNCCSAPIYDDSDICSCCKEHCGGIEECPQCEGTGQIKVKLYQRDNVPLGGLTDIIEWKDCRFCEGEGFIEVEL